jgi:hypothetical protein
MITEMRLLIFGEDDLLAVFRASAAVGDAGLPVGNPKSADVRVMPALGIDLLYEDGNTHPVTADQTVQAMVGYCGRLGIPLPKRGDKYLDVRGRQVALKMTFPAQPADAGTDSPAQPSAA